MPKRWWILIVIYYLRSLKGIHCHHFYPLAVAVLITEMRDCMHRDLKRPPPHHLATPVTESLPELLSK